MFALTRYERFIRWCRDQGLDLLGRDTSGEGEARAVPAGAAAAPAAPAALARQPRSELAGLEMTVARIIPQSFDELTVEEAREILERTPQQKARGAWLTAANHLTERPDTFAFQTREGSVGLLQMQADAKDQGKLTIRYRLEPRNGPTGR